MLIAEPTPPGSPVSDARSEKAHEPRTTDAIGEGANRPSARRHTVVLSDVHLSQAHPEDPADPLWMRYRRREHHPDADFARLVDELMARFPGDPIELCFNGDVLDFDAPWVVNGTSSFDEFPLDDERCAAHAARIMADHEGWFRAAARLLLGNGRVLFLSGNHDIELYWPGVRRAIRAEVARLAEIEAERLREIGGDPTRGLEAERLLETAREVSADIDQRVRFRAWFHITEDRIYLEHGSQYDHLNCARHAMLPLILARTLIQPECGKLAFKRTGSRMGYFNPYYEETFYLGARGYLAHFWRFYARSKTRHIGRVWLSGAIHTAFDIWRHRSGDERDAEGHELACEETGATLEAVKATHALRAKPAEDTMIPILRELWLDRIFATSFILLATLAIALVHPSATAIGLGVMIALFTLYEIVTPKPDIRTYDSAPPEVRRILDIHDVRAMCMGHTHRPFSIWDEKGFSGNSGSWCPAFTDQECTNPVLTSRPFLLLTSEHGALYGGLHWLKDGVIEAEPGRVRSREEGGKTGARLTPPP